MSFEAIEMSFEALEMGFGALETGFEAGLADYWFFFSLIWCDCSHFYFLHFS